MSDLVMIRKNQALISVADFKDILTRYQGAFGVAIADGNDITVLKGKLNFDKGVEAQAESLYTQQTDKQWSENARFTAFFSGPALSPESQQPFTIIGNSDDLQIVAYLSAGDYSQHAEANSLHTPAFFAMAKFLRPRLMELATRVDGDIDKLFELINEQSIEDELVKGVFGPNETGSFTILFYDGRTIVTPCEKTPGISKEWGWVSTPPVIIKNNNKPKLSLNVEPAADPSEIVLVKPRLDVADTKPAEQVVVKSAAEINATLQEAKPKIWARPKGGFTNGVVKGLYTAFNISRTTSGHGFIPNAWRDRCIIQVDPKWLSHKDFKTSMEVVDNPTPDQLLASASKKAVQVASKPSDVTGMMVMNAKQKQEFLDDLTMKGYINASHTRSADDLKKDEVDTPSFFDATGFHLPDLKRHSPASLLHLIKTYPEIAVIALRNAMLTVIPAAATSQPLPSATSVPSVASSPGGKKPRLTLAM